MDNSGIRILVVDDENDIRKIVRLLLQKKGYSIFEASNGAAAVEFVQNENVDFIIMDIMMPELDGFSAMREIRKASNVPIIMLSARGEEYDKISGFEMGADDYVTKPFSPKELMLRCAALFKRTGGSDTDKPYVFGGLTVDITARIVTVDGKRVDMSPKEYDLLFYMVENKGIALSRDKLITAVWGYDYYGDERTLDTHIKLLRKSLGAYSDMIVTLRGMGYRFEGENALS
jgi:DNA-binding response OmpR family regulator